MTTEFDPSKIMFAKSDLILNGPQYKNFDAIDTNNDKVVTNGEFYDYTMNTPLYAEAVGVMKNHMSDLLKKNLSRDSDGDGIPNSAESNVYGRNPYIYTSDIDSDGDWDELAQVGITPVILYKGEGEVEVKPRLQIEVDSFDKEIDIDRVLVTLPEWYKTMSDQGINLQKFEADLDWNGINDTITYINTDDSSLFLVDFNNDDGDRYQEGIRTLLKDMVNGTPFDNSQKDKLFTDILIYDGGNDGNADMVYSRWQGEQIRENGTHNPTGSIDNLPLAI